MTADDLNKQLAAALGAPRFTRKLVLTLEAGESPRIEYEYNAHEANGQSYRIILDGDALRAVRFRVRLEPAE